MPHLALLVVALAAAAILLADEVRAEEHIVKMLNKSGSKQMQFEPAFLKAAPGDTVKFVPTDKSHNAESIKEMWPEGAAPFKGAMNQEVILKLDQEGVYGVKCMPHYSMGMVALIQVGGAKNLDAVKAAKTPGAATKNFEELFTKVTP